MGRKDFRILLIIVHIIQIRLSRMHISGGIQYQPSRIKQFGNFIYHIVNYRIGSRKRFVKRTPAND